MVDDGKGTQEHSGGATDARDRRSTEEILESRKGGGLVPKDSRNVTGTATTEDGRWTGAAVGPEEGPRVPRPKD